MSIFGFGARREREREQERKQFNAECARNGYDPERLGFNALQVLVGLFNWPGALKAIIEDVVHDPTLLQTRSWTFFIPYWESTRVGMDAATIETTLNVHGIDCWGGLIVNGEFLITVSKNDAKRASEILASKQVPTSRGSGNAPYK